MLTPEDLIQITRGKAPWPYTPLELVRSRVTHAYPWMTTLIARLEVIEDLTIPLAATDGRRMWVNTPVLEKKVISGLPFSTKSCTACSGTACPAYSVGGTVTSLISRWIS